MLEYLLFVPLITGILAFFMPAKISRLLLVGTGTWNLGFSIYVWIERPEAFFNQYFKLSPEGLLVLLVISFLFFIVSLYSISYLEVTKLSNKSVYTGSMLLFLATMSMATISDDIIVFWIAIEATTLASAPLILLHKTKASLEATWKYVLICSVGIALALLGSVLMTISMDIAGIEVSLTFSELTNIASQLDKTWLKAGFIFVLVGYGTKMGLAPMHTWLPDAHSEAPSPASALLSGVLLNCAYLGILKTSGILFSADLGQFTGNVLIAFGLMSVIAGATFILKQSDYKRLLAYSSIENMGIIAFGTGIGGIAAYGAMLHLIHHSLIKSSLFLSSGNILLGYGSKVIEKTGSMTKHLPKTFVCFFGGIVGLVGLPPFGIFVSKLLIIIGAFQQGRYIVVGVLLVCLLLISAGLMRYVMKISFNPTETIVTLKEKPLLILPQLALLFVSIILCFWIPEPIYQTIIQSISGISGGFYG
ncbi:MAG: hydrogenase [Deltaproteobacteria bacterium]|jgi:hydrogenase-4 component F|nr:hydrogenase [Deltaproteobacteria bacterium]